mmetsp:Transcript_7887/g.11909  ORF Transcript_7887/g.11909 Transcript_7887/m.11909 type:complete len:232 (-) Transcript_7887:52-747(-)
MLPRFLIFQTADESIGRVDTASLSQQALMELLIQGITRSEIKIQSDDGEDDISQWKGVFTNSSEEITEITWNGFGITGHVDFQWLPPTLANLSIHSNSLTTKRLDLQSFPPNIVNVKLSCNRFVGHISLTSLPQKIEILAVSFNQLSGTVDLEHLPETMRRLYLNNNMFNGTVCLTKLPRSMLSLNLGNNDFFGEIDCTNLPETFTSLNVACTRLTGEVPLEKQFRWWAEG